MVVQSFSAEHRWHADFAAFCAFMGLSGDRGVRHERRLEGDRRLSLAWGTGAEAMGSYNECAPGCC